MNNEVQQKKALLPLGVDNFAELVTPIDKVGNRYLFIDKTLFIKTFMEGNKISLITRPRRFGKTLNLSMLQHFLAAEVSGESTKGLFESLKISKHPEIMAYQGQYPVIFLTLKQVRGRKFALCFEQLREEIRGVFKQHRYLLNSNITEEDRLMFKQFLMRTASANEYQNALKFLSELLYQHTSKKIIILLDEYDTPIHDSYVHGYYEKCRSFLAGMFGTTFKGNNALEKGLITGILKVGKASLFSELNNVYVYTMLKDRRYASYFGFTEEETDDLLDRAGLPQEAHELKEMYNGYQVEGYTLYNPFSIVSFIQNLLLEEENQLEAALEPYWVNTGGTHLIADIVQHNITNLADGFRLLIQGEPLQTTINESVVFKHQLRYSAVDFWSILLLSGYLKIVDKTKDARHRYTYSLCFPNQEIKQVMEDMVLDIVAGEEVPTYWHGVRSLIQGDIEAFTTFLQTYVQQVPSYFDTGKRAQEPYFHGLMIGMVTCLWESYHITSNRESGSGRYDIALEPKDKNKPAILVEIKIAKEEEKLEEVAKAAYQQIQHKDYAADMKAKGISNIIYLGIAFRGKAVALVS